MCRHSIYFKPNNNVVLNTTTDFHYVTFNIENIEYNTHIPTNYSRFRHIVMENKILLESSTGKIICKDRVSIRIDNNGIIDHVQYIQ